MAADDVTTWNRVARRDWYGYGYDLGRHIWVVVAVVAALLIAVVVWRLFFVTHTLDLYVEELTWDRAAEEEQFRTVRQEDWTTPPDARNVESWRAIHHWRQVLSHFRQMPYSCGTSEFPRTCFRQEPVYRDEPVYRTKYGYDVDRWVHNRWREANGDHLRRPFWPIPETMRREPEAELGALRIGKGRRESYKVRLSRADIPGRVYFQDVDNDTWNGLTLSLGVVGYANSRGHLRSVDWKVSP